jgi:hypothetical protein
MDLLEKRAYWQQHLAGWAQSGQTQRAYCEQHGLKLANFAYWRKRQGAANRPTKLIALSPAPSNATVQLTVSGLQMAVPVAALE